MRLLLLVILFTLQFFAIGTSQANFVAWDRPNTENEEPIIWLVKESEHFRITYPEENSVMASKALNIAERVHSELVPFFGFSISGKLLQLKTEMVLVDDFDFSNGWATFYPFSQIRLFSSPPDSVGGLEVNDDWLHSLIRHEYVHILQLEMARGAPSALRGVFGRVPLLFPHTITPSFMLEGLATYLETNDTLGYGRLQGSFYAMQMRTEVAEQQLKSLGDVSASLRNLPFGMPYLYGSYFFKYLAQTYSEQAIQTYLSLYSGQLLPGLMQNRILERVINKDFDDVWLDYHAWLKKQFIDQIDVLKYSRLQGEPLQSLSDSNVNSLHDSSDDPLDQGLYKDSVSSHGRDFYYIHNNGEDAPQLRSYSLTGKGDNSLRVETDNVIALDVNDQKEIVISRMITWADGRSWADLFLLEEGLLGQKWNAITHKSRLRNVRWLNNDVMIASRKVHGISELVMLDKQGNMVSVWKGKDETTVVGDFDVAYRVDTSFKLMPDLSSELGLESSAYVVAAVKRAGQGWNLERFELTDYNVINLLRNSVSDSIGDTQRQPSGSVEMTASTERHLTEKSWQAITDTKAVENSPQILPDGRILFSADYDGIYNLYTLNPQTQELTQLTNMLTGAFEPKLIHHKKEVVVNAAFNDDDEQTSVDNHQIIIFQAYTAQGFEFRKIALNNDHEDAGKRVFNLSEKQGRYDYPAPFTIDVNQTEAKPYSPWSNLTPKWWLPYYSSTAEATQWGIMTGGTDTLARHNYELSLGIDWQNQLGDIRLYYGYDNRYQLSFQRIHEYIDVINDSQPEFIVEQDRWVFARTHIANAMEDQLSLHAGIVVEREGSVERDNLFFVYCPDGLGKRHKTCEKTLGGLALRFDNRESYLNSPGFSAGRYLDLVYEHNEVFSGVFDSDYQGGILQGQWQEYFDLPGRRSLLFQVIAARGDNKSDTISLGGDERFSEMSLFGRDNFALRGYGPSVQTGHNININRINYNQWLARIDKGWGIWPIGAGDISTDLYVDYGSAWYDDTDAHYLAGIGIDVNIEILGFYNLIMPLKLSIARGLDHKLGENRVGFGISVPY